MADASDVMPGKIKAEGLVKIYKSCPDDIKEVKPDMVVKANVTPTLAPVLKAVTRKYSDPSSKLLEFLLSSYILVIDAPHFRVEPKDICQ